MRKLIILFILFLESGITWAQMIRNRNCEAFTEAPYFDTAFVRKNKIHSILGSTSIKKEMDIIRETDLIQYYEFDAKGRLIKQMYSHHKFNDRLDTTTIMYYYDTKGRLTTRRQNDNYSFYSYNYEYDSAGNIIREVYSRDENCGPSKYAFKLGKQYEITSEKYSYKMKSDGSLAKYYYNSLDRPYMEAIFKSDSLGFIIYESRSFSLTSRMIYEAHYLFNEGGRVSNKKEITDFRNGTGMEYKYGYDDKGNLTEYREVKAGVETIYREILYDEYTGLLRAVLTKDQRTEVIGIVKFAYTFFD
jgi:YD repeat-containing protein